jgi:hypothetical protein
MKAVKAIGLIGVLVLIFMFAVLGAVWRAGHAFAEQLARLDWPDMKARAKRATRELVCRHCWSEIDNANGKWRWCAFCLRHEELVLVDIGRSKAWLRCHPDAVDLTGVRLT